MTDDFDRLQEYLSDIPETQELDELKAAFIEATHKEFIPYLHAETARAKRLPQEQQDELVEVIRAYYTALGNQLTTERFSYDFPPNTLDKPQSEAEEKRFIQRGLMTETFRRVYGG